LGQDGRVAPADQDDDPETGEERRRHPRAPVELQLSLRFSSVQQFLSAYAGDISESGMFIRGWGQAEDGTPREVGQIVTLRFDAGHERIVQGTARIVRVVRGENDFDSGIGVEFVELDETGRKLIEMIVRIKLAAG
jgi:c-di-GMP-binding flagellar brake protein YcgR